MTADGPWKGLRADQTARFIGYEQAERMLAALLHDAEPFQADAIAGIARGGLVPATMVSCLLARPLFILGCDRARGSAHWLGPVPEARRLLLVDDCCATGFTMRTARDMLTREGRDVRTMAIVHDPEGARYIPDFSHPMRDYFRFPWERGEQTPAARALRATGAPADRLTEEPFVGLDLDGVFLPDIPKSDYALDLADALRRRAALRPFDTIPRFTHDRAVVITARPEIDRAPTEAWLARWGHAALRLECRPADVGDEIAAIARYKAAAATRLGCTHFIESEPELAIRIAAEAPHLIVSWWSADAVRAWVVGAAARAD